MYSINTMEKKYSGIYEPAIKKITKLLTRDKQLQEDCMQEMRLELFRSGHARDTKINNLAIWKAKNRAIDYLRKFLKGQIPFGSMDDIASLLDDKNGSHSTS